MPKAPTTKKHPTASSSGGRRPKPSGVAAESPVQRTPEPSTEPATTKAQHANGSQTGGGGFGPWLKGIWTKAIKSFQDQGAGEAGQHGTSTSAGGKDTVSGGGKETVSGGGKETVSGGGKETVSGGGTETDIWGIVFLVAFGLLIASVAATNAILHSDLSSGTKQFLVWLYYVGILFLALFALGIWQRTNSGVQKVYTVLLMLGVVAGVLLPVFFLSHHDRVIVLKLAAIVVLSMLPGLLYLQFIATRGLTLRDEFLLNLRRLGIRPQESASPSPEGSPVEVESADTPGQSIHERKFEAVFGKPVGRRQQYTLPPGNRLPLVLATLVLALGWTVVLEPEPIVGRHLGYLGDVTLNGRPLLPVEAIRYGFAGAYFFILQVVARRYFQDDLKPNAYLTTLQRVIVVTLLVTAVHQVWPGSQGQEDAFAFLVGVFPDSALRALIALGSKLARPFIPNLENPYPLSDLDGMNIWYESRLLEEGIEDMQSLATSNIEDVMLRTRVPVDRLVDWIDQSHLFLHVSKEANESVGSNDDQERVSDRQALRILGVRTATDLEHALGINGSPGGQPGRRQPDEAFVVKFRSALNHGRPADWPSVTESIALALQGEPNLQYVRNWKWSRPASDAKDRAKTDQAGQG